MNLRCLRVGTPPANWHLRIILPCYNSAPGRFEIGLGATRVKIRSKLLTKLAGWLVGTLFRAMSRTLRFDMILETPGTDCSVEVRRTYIYALWHDEILVPLARKALCDAKIAALVSRHQDGAYLTEFMNRIGVRSIRGSTQRGGDQALRELIRQDDDCHLFITPDGPRGPHHQLKEGIVYLASRTGRPIIPIASYCHNAWYVPGKWTGLWIPKPFSRCSYLLGAPLDVPPDLTRAQVARERERIQIEIERLERKLRLSIGVACGSEGARRAA